MANRIQWIRHYPFGVDSLAITPDGRKIYLPTGENSPGNRWEVVRPVDGRVMGSIRAGHSPHDTVVSLNGHHVYLFTVGKTASTPSHGIALSPCPEGIEALSWSVVSRASTFHSTSGDDSHGR